MVCAHHHQLKVMTVVLRFHTIEREYPITVRELYTVRSHISTRLRSKIQQTSLNSLIHCSDNIHSACVNTNMNL